MHRRREIYQMFGELTLSGKPMGGLYIFLYLNQFFPALSLSIYNLNGKYFFKLTWIT